MIEFQNVTFAYPKGPQILKGLSLKLNPATFYLIKGPSGEGKSSFLRLINRLEEPQDGTILFKERSLSDYRPQDLRRSIVYVQQTPMVVDGSVKENLLLPYSFKNNADLTAPEDSRLLELLDRYRLERVNLKDTAKNLSVGQRQRLCLIRGLLLKPEVTLFDEPTSALDEESAQIVEKNAFRLCQEFGQTVVMVSHRPIRTETFTPVKLELIDGKITNR